MAQKIKVQDGIVVYQATDPADDVNFGIDGNLNVSKSAQIGAGLLVGNDPHAAGSISTEPGQNLILTTGANVPPLTGGGNLNISPTGSLLLNGAIWPILPNATQGSYLGASSTNTLAFYTFALPGNPGDSATSAQLNALYPTAQPGQNAYGPTVAYQCISPLTWRTLQPNLGYTPVNNAGSGANNSPIAMTGELILFGDPTQSMGAVTKHYADQISANINVHGAVETATAPTANLSPNTYTNGVSGGGFDTNGLGVGATLISLTNVYIDDIGIGGYNTLSVGSRILVKDQADPRQNGIYNVTDLGATASTGVPPARPWILTRSSDYNNSEPSQVHSGDTVYVQEGNLAGTQWAETDIGTGPNDTIVIGVSIYGDNINFTQFAGPGNYTAGIGISLASNIITNTGVLSNIAGTGISISGPTGNVTIDNAGVLSAIAGTNIAVSGATGNVTISLTGTVPIAAVATVSNTSLITATTTNSSFYPAFVSATSGDLALNVDSNLTYNPSTSALTMTGNITANEFFGSGAGLTNIPSGSVTNGSITIGTTTLALGSTTSTLAGLTSVTSVDFTGALIGNATTSTTLATVRSISATGDATWTVNFDGSADATAAIILAASGATAGTYQSVTVNSKGLVTAGSALSSSNVTTALGFTPYDAANPAGYISGITSSNVTTALGFTPYDAANPAGYTTNTGTVTSVGGTGTVSGLTLSGTVTTSGNLTLGGTLSLTSSNVTTALGYTPYNATNPSGYISGITSSNITTALGYTPASTTGSNVSGTWPISITGTSTYATNAGTSSLANTLLIGGSATTFNWSGQIGQPTWLWGGNSPGNMYVYNPSNFDVNYATTAGNSATVTTVTASQVFSAISGQSNTDFYRTSGSTGWYNSTYATGIFSNSAGLVQTYNGASFYSANDITAGGTVTGTSDERLKTNWRNFDSNFITNLANLKSGIYDRTDIGTTQVGVGAQSLQKFMSDAVIEDEKGFLSVAYGNAALASSVELAKEVIKLNTKIELQQEIINELSMQIQNILKIMNGTI